MTRTGWENLLLNNLEVVGSIQEWVFGDTQERMANQSGSGWGPNFTRAGVQALFEEYQADGQHDDEMKAVIRLILRWKTFIIVGVPVFVSVLVTCVLAGRLGCRHRRRRRVETEVRKAYDRIMVRNKARKRTQDNVKMGNHPTPKKFKRNNHGEGENSYEHAGTRAGAY